MRYDIVYASDKNLEDIAAVSIASLLHNNGIHEFNIYFLDAGVTEQFTRNLQTLVRGYGSSVTFIDVCSYLDSIKKTMPAMGQSYGTYSRLFIDALLPECVDRCLYIDCDTIVCSDISPAFENKQEYPLTMCYDLMSKNHKENIGIGKRSAYFNAGIILMSLSKLRNLGFSSKLKSLLKEVHDFKFHDQDIINILLNGEIGLLPMEYNVQSQNFYLKSAGLCHFAFNMTDKIYYDSRQYDYALSNAKILHFTSVHIMPRPWFKNSNHPQRQLFEKYAAMLPWQTHFYEKKFTIGTLHGVFKFLYDFSPLLLFAPIMATVYKLLNYLDKR